MTMESTKPHFKGGSDSGGPVDERRKRRWIIIVAVAIGGWAVGFFVFGWWLAPVAFEGATLEQLNKADKERFFSALTELYSEERDPNHIQAILADWPAAAVEICRTAAETGDEFLAVRLTALATELNGVGCMQLAYRQFDETVETGRQFTTTGILIVAGLFMLLVADFWLIRRVSRRLSSSRRQRAKDEALAGVADEGSSTHVIGRVVRAPFTSYILRRLAAIPLTLLIVTAVIYALIMIADPLERASLYLPPNIPTYMTQERMEQVINQIVEEHGLDDPYPVQYFHWLANLIQGDWGWSPNLQDDVLPALLRRTPVTLELTLFALLLFVPLGFLSGLRAGWKANSPGDHRFRIAAFIATALPPFVLGLFMLSIFYVGLGWFPPGRTGFFTLSLNSSTFENYTGLLTIDGLLNGRLDVTLDALRHLVLPVFVLSLFHWATLSRITRASVIEVKDQDYIMAARARGVKPRALLWRHTFRNAIGPGITATALSVAALLTGVFVIERIFGLHGLSELAILGMQSTPDAALALGFAVYTALIVLPIMFILDVLGAALNPRALSDREHR